MGPKIPKYGSRETHMTPFDLILHIFALVLTATHLYAKFEVSTFIWSGDIGSSRNLKSGLRDPDMTPFDLILILVR